MPIVRNPTAATLAELYTSFSRNPATARGIAAGNTEAPTGYVLPSFAIQSTQDQGARLRANYYGKLNLPNLPPAPASFTAKLVVARKAAEGNNRALYLKDGIYETNYTMSVSTYKTMIDDEAYAGANVAAGLLEEWRKGCDRVYFVMPLDIALLNLAAEKEHCDDFIRAYSLTLGALQDALDLVDGRVMGPSKTAREAEALVEKAIDDQIPQALKALGRNASLWGPKYLQICDKSKQRDTSNWHSWGLELIEAKDVPSLTTYYLTGQQREEKGRVYLKFTRGQTQIGTHPSTEVVKL